MLIVSHCHLDFKDFSDELETVVERSRRAGVGLMLTICTTLSKFDGVRAVADRFPDVYCSVGVHPHEAAAEGLATPDRLIELSQHEKVVGIGETGLDYYYDNSPPDDQRINFKAHINAARATGLPLIVHSRDADDEMIEILRSAMEEGPFTGVMHCFSSGRKLAEKAVEIGFYISLSGILTFKSAGELREIAKDVPIDKLLVETDAPYLSPVPYRGKRNEPSYVVETAKFLAEVRGIEIAELEELTTHNFKQLFKKVPATAYGATLI